MKKKKRLTLNIIFMTILIILTATRYPKKALEYVMNRQSDTIAPTYKKQDSVTVDGGVSGGIDAHQEEHKVINSDSHRDDKRVRNISGGSMGEGGTNTITVYQGSGTITKFDVIDEELVVGFSDGRTFKVPVLGGDKEKIRKLLHHAEGDALDLLELVPVETLQLLAGMDIDDRFKQIEENGLNIDKVDSQLANILNHLSVIDQSASVTANYRKDLVNIMKCLTSVQKRIGNLDNLGKNDIKFINDSINEMLGDLGTGDLNDPEPLVSRPDHIDQTILDVKSAIKQVVNESEEEDVGARLKREAEAINKKSSGVNGSDNGISFNSSSNGGKDGK